MLVTIFLVTLSSPTILYTFYNYFGINLLQRKKADETTNMNSTFVENLSFNGTMQSSSSSTFMLISNRWFYLACSLLFCVVSTFLIFKKESESAISSKFANRKNGIKEKQEEKIGEPLQSTKSEGKILSTKPISSAPRKKPRSRLFELRQNRKNLRLTLPVNTDLFINGREEPAEIQDTHNNCFTSHESYGNIQNNNIERLNEHSGLKKGSQSVTKRSETLNSVGNMQLPNEDSLRPISIDEGQTAETLSICQTYLCMWDIVRLRPILLYIGLLFVFAVRN